MLRFKVVFVRFGILDNFDIAKQVTEQLIIFSKQRYHIKLLQKKIKLLAIHQTKYLIQLLKQNDKHSHMIDMRCNDKPFRYNDTRLY